MGSKRDFFISEVRNAIIYKNDMTTISPELEEDDVKVVNLALCQIQREYFTFVNALRTLSETIKSPLVNLIKETRIVYEYSIKDNGCPAPIPPEMEGFMEKVTESLGEIMSWLPYYNRVRLVSLIAASVINMIADAIENKELSLSSAIEVNDYMLSLTKDIISSLSTKQMKDMDSVRADAKIKKMMKNIKYKKNKLTIRTKNPGKTVFIDSGYNNFVDKETQKALYYDSRNYWYISRDESFLPEVKDVIEKNYGHELSGSDISIIKNSSPGLYADGTFIRRNGIMQVLVEGHFYHVSEMYVSDNIYRYVAYRDNKPTPVINIGGAWFFESRSTHSASHELINFLVVNEKIKSKLISKNIIHADVAPIRFSKRTQLDKNGKKYIKVDNNYYLLKHDVRYSNYIEGEYDILPVKFNSYKYRFNGDIFGDMYNFYKKEVGVYSEVNEDKKAYLDSSIIKKMSEYNLLEDAPRFIDEGELKSKHIVMRSEIYGAISVDGGNFIVFDNKLIKIVSNNDDTFLLGGKNRVRAYKNMKGSTYYYMTDENNDDYRSQTFKKRHPGCITKRQLFSLCSTGFHESKDITKLLKQNARQGVHFDNPDANLVPYGEMNGFYKERNSEEKIYFLSQQGVFFHAREEKYDDKMIPTFFKIYGKNSDNSINHNLLISDVSIVKDFDTRKSIVSTPSEAMKMVFNLDLAKSDSLIHWSEEQILRKPIDTDFRVLEDIQKKLDESKDLDHVSTLFSVNGKKVVTSIKHSDHYIETYKHNFIDDTDDYVFKSMSSIEKSGQHSLIMEVFDEAFKRTTVNIDDACSLIEDENSLVDDYISSKLRLTCSGARKIFINTLLSKLKRMRVVFDENDKSNIILGMKESVPRNNKKSSAKDRIVGFTYIHDPLDRIYIKTDPLMLNDDHEMTGWEKTRYYDKKKINIANIMCHEAVHALGTPEDYFYHNSIEEGEYDTIENTLARTEIALRRGRGVNDAFIDMCTLYFMSNPVYKRFEINSLLKPEALSLLFQYDDYLRSLILVNNPDTITVIINDLANMK